MTKFIDNYRTDALQTDINLFFYDNNLSNCQLSLADASHKFQIHVSVRILTIKISQWTCVKFFSYDHKRQNVPYTPKSANTKSLGFGRRRRKIEAFHLLTSAWPAALTSSKQAPRRPSLHFCFVYIVWPSGTVYTKEKVIYLIVYI